MVSKICRRNAGALFQAKANLRSGFDELKRNPEERYEFKIVDGIRFARKNLEIAQDEGTISFDDYIDISKKLDEFGKEYFSEFKGEYSPLEHDSKWLQAIDDLEGLYLDYVIFCEHVEERERRR